MIAGIFATLVYNVISMENVGGISNMTHIIDDGFTVDGDFDN